LTRYRWYLNIVGMIRLRRPERSARNRDLVLDSAEKLFRDSGFHGATLEQIADAAGFSKGVIYSQFGSKDDLFLALMEQRMERRVNRSLDTVRDAPPGAVLRALWEQSRATRASDIPWALAVLEFRVHAARIQDLNRRYAALHARTLDRVSEIGRALARRAGRPARWSPEDIGRFIAILDIGSVLENLVSDPGASFELTRRALWLLWTDSEPVAPRGEEDPL